MGTGALTAADQDHPVCGISPLGGGRYEPHQRGCPADGPQTAEQLYQRNIRTVKKVLGPTTDFPTWG